MSDASEAQRARMRELGRKGGIRSGESRRRLPKEMREQVNEEAKALMDELVPEALELLALEIRQQLDPQLDVREKHPKLAHDAAVAVLSWAIGKPGQELTLKSDAAPPAFLWNHPAVHGASKLAIAMERAEELPAPDGSGELPDVE